MREEKVIFNDLAKLCSSIGYAHVIAHLCFRDNIIAYRKQIRPQDILHQFSTDRLVRTEISTLIGLMFKTEIDISQPNPGELQKMIQETELLLNELHQSMIAPMLDHFNFSKTEQPNPTIPFPSGAVNA